MIGFELIAIYNGLKFGFEAVGLGPMKKTLLILMAVALVGCGKKKPSYEFRIEFFDDGTAESQLDSLGNLGWTVVGSRRASNALKEYGYECILQREK